MINIFQVGGSVRDQILGQESKDIDYAVEAVSFEAMREHIVGAGGTIFLETPQYFTIRAKMPKLGAADFVLCRKDGSYSDGRRPDSVTVGTIYDDLARRDFTMNAIAIDIASGEIIDPYKGSDDIANKIIRCVGHAQDRLKEDRLRAFRALRFSVTKNFDMAGSLTSAINYLLPEDFTGVSTERIREELFKALKVNTRKTCRMLFDNFSSLGDVVAERGIWFEPTTKA